MPIFPSLEEEAAGALSVHDFHIRYLQGLPRALLFKLRVPILVYFTDNFL